MDDEDEGFASPSANPEEIDIPEDEDPDAPPGDDDDSAMFEPLEINNFRTNPEEIDLKDEEDD